MAARARDLLLTWGRFSPQYLARARFDEARSAAEVGWGLARLVCLAVGTPTAAVAFYLVPLPGPDSEGMWPLLSYTMWAGSAALAPQPTNEAEPLVGPAGHAQAEVPRPAATPAESPAPGD